MSTTQSISEQNSATVNKPILLSSPTMHGEEMAYINEAFERNWVAPLGFNCDLFEEEVANYVNSPENGVSRHTLCLTSGTSSLHLAFKLAGVKRGERIFCSDMTFVATINPAVYEGAVPVFIDSEQDTWNMDPVALEKAFLKYPEVRVVVLVHLYGTPAKVDEIMAVCEKYGAILIEDSAESLASVYKGQKCGTFGKYGIYSFNGNKIITTSGGGMLLCDNEKCREKALFWATQARDNAPWYQHSENGYNYRMSNVLAGIGRGQLLHLDEHCQRKKEIYSKYREAFKGLPVTMNPYLACSKPNFWLSCLLIDKGVNVSPMDIIEELAEKNIETRPLWKPMHLQPLFDGCDFITAEDKTVDEDLFSRGICLPSDIKMTDAQQDYIVEVIKSCF